MQMNRFPLHVFSVVLTLLLFGCGGNSDSSGNSVSSGDIQMGGSIQGKPLVLSQTVSTFAGPGTMDGAGATVWFTNPTGVTTDGASLYVTDSDSHTIRKIDIATGKATTFAGSDGASGSADGIGAAARFNSPSGITTEGRSLFVTDSGNQTIRTVDIATGAVTTLAGAAGVLGSSDGTGLAARFYGPRGIATDGTNLFVTEAGNQTIRKVIIASGVVATLAGSAGISGSTDGTGTAARFTFPEGITTDGTNLFVTDLQNCTIRKVVIATGVVTTLAGTAGVSAGSKDGTGAEARFFLPKGIITDGVNLFVADSSNNTIRQVVIATGAVTTIAGSAGISGSADGTGAAAMFYYPAGITSDGTNLFVVDSQNKTIRKVEITTGVVTTLAGTAGASWSADGTGADARFFIPSGITTDGANLFVTDSNNHTIRKIEIATGLVTTLAGAPGQFGAEDGTGTSARFHYPGGITTDGTNVFLADGWNNTIRKVVIETGVVTTLAGTSGASGSVDGTGAAARFNNPNGITTDGMNLFVTEAGNHTIRKVVLSTGAVTTLAGAAGVLGSADGTGATARFNNPVGITPAIKQLNQAA
jgi:sugar lactone lactonase YvrE